MNKIINNRLINNNEVDESITSVFTDGSSKYNKRGSSKTKGGIGVFFSRYDKRNISAPFLLENPTSNRCELYAVIVAIEIFLRTKCNNKKETLLIHTDSMHTIDCLSKWIFNWKKTGWIKSDGRPVLNRDLLYWADKLISGNKNKLEVSFIHVKAHTKKPKDENSVHYKIWYGNYMADKLATDSTKMTKCK